MKTSSPPLVDRSKAWSCLVTNLLVLPGLGSVMAGSRAGWWQIIFSVLGFILIVIALVQLGLYWIGTQQFPDRFDQYLWLIIGLVLFVGAWVWSLMTGYAILKATPPRDGRSA